jgi:alkylation response protein AidB-like acyl-CoA dehydrogenase
VDLKINPLNTPVFSATIIGQRERCQLESRRNDQWLLEDNFPMRKLDFLGSEDTLETISLCEGARKFAEKHLSPQSTSGISYSRATFKHMAALGFTATSAPEKLGGTPLSALENSALLFELARIQLGPAVYLSVHQMVIRLIARHGAGETLEQFVQDLASGKSLGAFCLTEAQAGSDASALRTSARKTEGGYSISGEKIYITSAGIADLYLVFARTSADQKRGISAFVVHKESNGLSFGKPEEKMGCEGSPIATVTLNECFVPESHRVGMEGEGYKIALSGLAGGRVSIAAQACGLAARATELALNYARERKQFGQAIGEFQGIQFMLADMYLKTRASILMTREAAQTLDRGESGILEASSAKCFATDRAMEVTTDAVQIYGGAGYLRDYEVERLMRDAKMLQIVEGTNQIQRLVIAKALL